MSKCTNCGRDLPSESVRFCPTCGAEQIRSQKPGAASVFTGGAFANFFIGLLTGFVTLITLGLAYPAMVCWQMRWEASHTYINGRRLKFDGKAGQLFGKYLLWMFLSVITFGIYFVIKGKLLMIEWKTKHTHFEGVEVDKESNQSCFTGKWYQLFGVNFVARLVTVVTLTFGAYWAHCYKERWFAKHTVIDGHAEYFDGKGIQYFGKRVLWTFLTIITLGIYAFWLIIKSKKWTVSHTFVYETDALPPIEEIPEKPKKPKNKKAISAFVWTLVLCILSFTGAGACIILLGNQAVLPIILCVTAIIIMIVCIILCLGARKKSAQYEGSGKKLATAGVVISIIFIVGMIGIMIWRGFFVQYGWRDILRQDKVDKCSHEHAQTIEAVAPTCTQDGNEGYKYCPDCDGVYVFARWDFEKLKFEKTEDEVEEYWFATGNGKLDNYPKAAKIPANHKHIDEKHNWSYLCLECGEKSVNETNGHVTYEELFDSTHKSAFVKKIVTDNYDIIRDAIGTKYESAYLTIQYNSLTGDGENITEINATFIFVNYDDVEVARYNAQLVLNPVDYHYISDDEELSIGMFNKYYMNNIMYYSFEVNFSGVVISAQCQLIPTETPTK